MYTQRKLKKNLFEYENGDPFEYYANAAGDLFNNGTTIKPYNLPFQLQRVYVKYWSEDEVGLLTYLVKDTNSNNFGIMFCSEYAIDNDDSNYEKEMDKLFDTEILPLARKFAALMADKTPNASVHVSKYSGVDNCHMLQFFLPATAKDEEFETFLYILAQSFRNSIAVEDIDVSEQNVKDFAASRVLNNVNKLIDGKKSTDFFVHFKTTEEKDSFTARIASLPPSEAQYFIDGLESDTIMDTLLEVVSCIKTQACIAGVIPTDKEIVELALCEIAPFHWEKADSVDSDVIQALLMHR